MPSKEMSCLDDRAQTGDPVCVAAFFQRTYSELRRMAKRQMAKEPAGHTLQATALVHEAFARLIGAENAMSASSGATRYFFAAAGEAMRRILVEHARARARLKRGGDGEHAARRQPMSVLDIEAGKVLDEDLIRLDTALSQLEKEDAGVTHVVRLRYFAGLSGDETARALGVSPSTVDRDMALARARLFRLMQEERSP